MERPRIAITGSEGVVGSVLTAGLARDFELVPIDIQKTERNPFPVDARYYPDLRSRLEGCEAVIHLAWNTETENWQSEKADSDNFLMVHNVYRAASEAGVRRLVMASSVHVDNYIDWDPSKGDMTVHQKPHPGDRYGKSKLNIEGLGRWYAQNTDLEVVCVRFGGIWPNDIPERFPENYLSHRDLVRLVKTILGFPSPIENRFSVLYGVSDNQGRFHDFSNSLGWKPQDGFTP